MLRRRKVRSYRRSRRRTFRLELKLRRWRQRKAAAQRRLGENPPAAALEGYPRALREAAPRPPQRRQLLQLRYRNRWGLLSRRRPRRRWRRLLNPAQLRNGPPIQRPWHRRDFLATTLRFGDRLHRLNPLA